jgi:carbon storage regulator
MLVLSRRQGETVMIQGGIAVKVLEIRGSAVRLGIEAPREKAILREELLRDSEGRLEWPSAEHQP